MSRQPHVAAAAVTHDECDLPLKPREYSRFAKRGDERQHPINTVGDHERPCGYHVAPGLTMYEICLRPHFAGGARLASGGVDE